jgi:hypothetical protein
MSRILNISESDYRVRVQSGGTITLDVGTGNVTLGTVVITGNLNVKGTTTTVESTVTTIVDPILQLNFGQTGAGIGAVNDLDFPYQSGIRIGRGSRPDALLVFDEQVTSYDPSPGVNASIPGAFIFKTNNAVLTGIKVASISTSSATDLVFDMQNTDSIIRIANTTGYESRVLADNDVPNKKYVNDYVSATGGYANVDNFHYLLSPNQTRGQAYNTHIDFTVMNALRATITVNGLTVDNINIYGDLIKSTSSNNLVLQSAVTNEVEINSILDLDNQTVLTNSSVAVGKTKFYTSTTAGPGKTGLYFLNKRTGEPGQSIDETVNDELIAKNRALLFSMLF